MRATIVDLRYNMKEVLKALERNEDVIVLYHGKEKGIIKPMPTTIKQKVETHAFFGMHKDDKYSVTEIMDQLRGGRYDDV